MSLPALACSLTLSALSWQAIDDVVMGGVSASSARVTEQGTVQFSGRVSLENNGGFASIRSADRRLDLSGGTGVALRVRGDGKRYKLSLRTGGGFDGVQYQAPFDTTANQWQVVPLPFEAFEPRWRGRLVPDAPALDPAAVLSIGVVIADRQAGPFSLELDCLGPLTVSAR
jgi:monofunctional biosynthetic peptidoglycan transglycosylase